MPGLSVLSSLKFVVFPLSVCCHLCISSALFFYLHTHPCVSVCFMYALKQHHGPSTVSVLDCFMLCSWVKQFRISVIYTEQQRTCVSFMGCAFLLPLPLQRVCVCVFWCPVPVSETGVYPPVLRFQHAAAHLESHLARKCSTNPIGWSFSKSFSNWPIWQLAAKVPVSTTGSWGESQWCCGAEETEQRADSRECFEYSST